MSPLRRRHLRSPRPRPRLALVKRPRTERHNIRPFQAQISSPLQPIPELSTCNQNGAYRLISPIGPETIPFDNFLEREGLGFEAWRDLTRSLIEHPKKEITPCTFLSFF